MKSNPFSSMWHSKIEMTAKKLHSSSVTPGFAVSVIVAFLAATNHPEVAFCQEPETPTREITTGNITVGKETTFIDGPLRADGTVDYSAAINAELSKGVTPQNNVAIHLIAMSTSLELTPANRDAFRAAFGIDEYPEEPTLISFHDHLRKEGVIGAFAQDELFENLEASYTLSFGREEFPNVVAWLESNRDAISRLRELTTMPKYWHPLGNTETPLFMSLLPLAQSNREFARALVSDAMYALRQGDFERAGNNLISARQLSVLTSNCETLVEMLISIALSNMVAEAEIEYCRHAREMMADDVVSYREKLNSFPIPWSTAERIDGGERFTFLDLFARCARGNADKAILEMAQVPVHLRGEMGSVDWNLASIEFNEYVDRIVTALKLDDLSERISEVKEIVDELDEAVEKDTPEGFFGKLKLNTLKREEKGSVAARYTANQLANSVTAVAKAEETGRVRIQMSRIAFALESYRIREGNYPDNLEKLVPEYFDQIPRDTLCGKDKQFRYQKKKDSYELTSVGRDGRFALEDEVESDDIMVNIESDAVD